MLSTNIVFFVLLSAVGIYGDRRSSTEDRYSFISALMNQIQSPAEDPHQYHTNWDNNMGDRDWYNYQAFGQEDQPFFGANGVGITDLFNPDRNQHNTDQSSHSSSQRRSSRRSRSRSSNRRSTSGRRPNRKFTLAQLLSLREWLNVWGRNLD